MRVFRLLACICALVPGAPMAAQERVLEPGVEACIQAGMTARTPIAPCLQEAQRACEVHAPGSPAALACHIQARQDWGDLIADLVASFDGEPVTMAEIARIEAKYAVSRNLMVCARQLELSLIGRDAGPEDQFALALCEAQAMGVAYAEVLIGAGRVVRPQ